MYKKTDLEFSMRSGISDALYGQESIKCESFAKVPYYQVTFRCGKLAPGWVQVRASLISPDGAQTLRVMQGDGLGGTEKTLYETELVKGGLVDVKRLAAITDKVIDIIWEACYA